MSASANPEMRLMQMEKVLSCALTTTQSEYKHSKSGEISGNNGLAMNAPQEKRCKCLKSFMRFMGGLSGKPSALS